MHEDAEPTVAGVPLGFRNPIFDVMVFKQQVRQQEKARGWGAGQGLVLGTVNPRPCDSAAALSRAT